MTVIDVRPQSVVIKAYAGDTLALDILSVDSYSAANNWTWQGDVRITHDESATPVVADGSFIFVNEDDAFSDPTNFPGMGYKITAVLTSDVTRALAEQATSGIDPGYVKPGTDPTNTLLTFNGIFDIQVVNTDTPPTVKTLVQGTLSLDADVTRL